MSEILRVDYSRTPTPLPAVPRRVRVRGGRCAGVVGQWVVRLFILPHCLVGVGLVLYLPLVLLWAVWGQTVGGQVTGKHISQDEKGSGSYMVDYSYVAGGRRRSGSTSVSRSRYDSINVPAAQGPEMAGAAVGVRYLGLGPFSYADLSEKSPWGEVGFALLFCVFWNGILSIFVYMVWVVPIRARLLCRYGVAATGHIKGVRSSHGKSLRCRVDYAFEAALVTYKGTIEVTSRGDLRALRVGDEVTILYWPRNPKRSTCYELGWYQVPEVGRQGELARS